MNVLRYFAALAGLCAGLLACSPPPATETVEVRDPDGRLERYERRKSDYAKEGRYQRFSAEGGLVEEAFFKNDTLDGERKLFYPGGKVEIVETYRRGVFHGPYRRYYESGALYAEQTYVDGQLEGLSTVYYPNGQVKEKVVLEHNEENGPFTEYYENGALKAEGSYIPDEDGGLEQGELREYDSTGVLVRIADCERGVCRTRWRKE